ncbi:cytochrome b/b6 domain-containing protein [Nocardioides guangzhouensis]|uniref:Cytochrome b/b6 domain-containing protein n=1 Tax=Nocardioides guangzhouensis TaxID=2497878 RepID=A0A4Q4Z1G7_9ACTN|nr:cytochrome b/b6 domain-containing protein [Nocardioides guangzhouensis]RYP80691.1 cytochrome b/b6 domain-containing protein [Nocardioides guangzhouensis]
MATDRATRPRRDVVERNGRAARWFHAGVYVAVLVLLGTGLWLLAGREGQPSPLSRLAGVPDTRLHVWVGWAFTGLVVGGMLLAGPAAVRFVRDSLRFDRGDLAWFRTWPAALLTGRFSRHEGRFDPGQRIAHVGLVLSLVSVTSSGVAMALLHGGPAFVWLVPLHTWSTYVLVSLVLGHVLIASGVLPGYRGVWRSMHLGGRLDARDARRLWPGWTERHHP